MGKKTENEKANILIGGDYGEGNIGDEIILSELVRLLSIAFPEAKLSVVTKKPETAVALGVEAVQSKNPLKFRSAFEKADIMVVAGGVMLENMLLNKSLGSYLQLLGLAKQKKTSIFIHAFSISPLLRSRERKRLISAIVDNASFISLRDRESYEWLLDSGFNDSKLYLMSDLALSMEPKEESETPKKKMSYAAFCLKESENTQRELRELKKFAKRLHEEEGLGILLASLSAEDRRVEKMFCDALIEERVPHISLGEGMAYEDVASIISQSEFVLSKRLHGLVFAALGGVRAVGLSDRDKLREFAFEMSYPLKSGKTATADTLFETYKKQKDGFSKESSIQRLRELREINRRVNSALVEAVGRELKL